MADFYFLNLDFWSSLLIKWRDQKLKSTSEIQSTCGQLRGNNPGSLFKWVYQHITNITLCNSSFSWIHIPDLKADQFILAPQNISIQPCKYLIDCPRLILHRCLISCSAVIECWVSAHHPWMYNRIVYSTRCGPIFFGATHGIQDGDTLAALCLIQWWESAAPMWPYNKVFHNKIDSENADYFQFKRFQYYLFVTKYIPAYF